MRYSWTDRRKPSNRLWKTWRAPSRSERNGEVDPPNRADLIVPVDISGRERYQVRPVEGLSRQSNLTSAAVGDLLVYGEPRRPTRRRRLCRAARGKLWPRERQGGGD